MMKTLARHIRTAYTSLAMLVAVLLHTSCNSDIMPVDAFAGQGTFALALEVGEVQSEVVTRNPLGLNVETFQVNLIDPDGASLIDGKKLSELTEAECTLPAGTGYQIKAESCTLDEAITLNEGWGMAHFVASTTFDIVSDQHTPVSLTCTMDNAGVQFDFDQSFLDKFPIHAVTTQDSRSLVFSKDTQDKIAYYPIAEDEAIIAFKFTGSAGGWSDRIDLTQEIALVRGKIYTVKVTYSENSAQKAKIQILGVN